MAAPLSIKSHFRKLCDPRRRHCREHRLLDMIVVAICAVIGGANRWRAIALFGRTHRAWFNRFLALPNGIPSYHTFARLFPGGEGRLVLTDPDDMLATGVEVEARPPGKKVKRLSLLSGGERSLVAVAFLVSLFKARPSPFYILDEVEAALDDTNLGRLLEIYEELRENSQLLVITHQKRTMEVGDALYGVTMRGDGVSTVISQRLRQESA